MTRSGSAVGEDLVAFRDTAGRAGLLAEHCRTAAPRCFLGRNEDGGIRCSYHGWKFDIVYRGVFGLMSQ
jgi:phthalate 4,5-dioxygenase oxygenase subunit